MQYAQFGPDGTYSCRRLGPPDLKALQALFDRCADYYEIATGAPAAKDEAERAFVAGPPDKPVDDKRTIGIFSSEDELVGVIDALLDWPEPTIWSLGMLLLDPSSRGSGLGTFALNAFQDFARKEGASRIRTAVVSHHERGVTFAHRAGYRPVRELEGYNAGARQARVLFLEKKLDQ